MKRKVLLALVLGMTMLMLAPSAQAFVFDPGDGGGTPDVYYLTIKVTGIWLANDGDLCGPGEVYMKNPGLEYWTVANAESMLGGTVYTGSSYHGVYYDPAYTVKYQQIISAADIDTKFKFELKDDDRVIDSTLWSGWIKLKSVEDCSHTEWVHANGDVHDFTAIKMFGLTGKYTEVGSGIYVWNQLKFTVTITH
jgi:hypothetical protein